MRQNTAMQKVLSLILTLVLLGSMMPVHSLARESEEAKENPWSGKSAVFVGDSITAGTGTTKIYYEYLKETLGFGSVTAMGVGGSCISGASDYGQGNQPLISRYQNIPSADLIVIFMGTNDYGHETPLGSASDTQDGTFYGALNTVIPALVEKHPSSKIVFVTSLHRYGAGTSKILGTKFTYDHLPNGVGATLGDYVTAAKTVCAKNGVSVIDLYTECTLDPSDTAVRDAYMPDGIHPNAAGHEVIAEIMASHILGYEPVETEPIELPEMIQGNKFAAGNNQPCRASSRVNYYLKAGTVITLKNPDAMQWACAKTSDEHSSDNLGYFPEKQWTDLETAVVAEDGWVGFTFKYRDETKAFDLTKPLSDYITIEVPHTHTYENGICTGCGESEASKVQPDNFRWEIVNGKLTDIANACFSPNTVTVLGGSIADGVISSGRYQLAKPLSLLHDQPWVVEWCGSGDWTGMLLATTSDAYNAGLPYFFKTGTDSGLVAFGYKNTQVNNYGCSLNPLGLDYTQSHTYRLENRIHQDGSNMVHLLVDNVEVGPMNRFYIGGSDSQNQTVDWLNGKDFSISALGTSSHPISKLKLKYLQVMESGHIHSYEAVVSAPTCTEQGYTTYTCTCGASYVDNYVDVAWHDNVDNFCSMCGCAMVRVTRDEITPSVGTVNSLDGTVNTTITTGWYWDIPIPAGAKQIQFMTFKTAASWGRAFLNGSTYISGVCETTEGYKWVTVDIPEGATVFRYGYLSDARAEQNGRPQFQYVEFSDAKQDISQYMPRPATGCHSFSVNVNLAPAMGDPDGNIVGTDYGYIMLPTNYTPYGEPTRLIIVCHGAGGKRSTYQSDSWKTDQNTFWTDMGYAIMDMAACPKPLTTDDRAIHYGNPTVVDCYKAGFDYVIENFNLKQDGIYVIGTSMGGLSSFQIVQSGKFPVLAQVGFCPAIDLFKQAYCAKWGSAERDYQKSHISSYFGFEGVPASFTNTFPTDAEIELYRNNFEKTVNYSPILHNVVEGDIASIFGVIPTTATGTDAAEAAIYAQLTATHPCPVMIIHSKDDSVVSYRYSQYFVDMLKRSGQEASLYTIDGVNHMAWQYGKNCTLQGLNGQVTIKESQYEAYKFFEKFEKHEEHQPWVDPAVKATCCTTGLTEGKHCASCGEILVNQNVIPTTNEHTYENGICTACGAEHPNLANYEGKVISILGDSSSTFAGYIPEADGFNLAHRARYPQSNLLTDVYETWWMQVITKLGAKMGVNDSWAGSQVLNTLDTNSGDLGPDVAMASLTRIQNLGSNGTPDVILFYGAGNDIGRAVPLGAFNPDSAPKTVDLAAKKWDTFADAYVAAILRLKHFYPDSTVVVMLYQYIPSYFTNAELDEYNSLIQSVCDHYNIPTIDLRNSGVTPDMLPDNIHPNAEGMNLITQTVLDVLMTDSSVEPGENVVYSVTHELVNATASKHYYKGVSAGSEFSETITGEHISITMGGVDITTTCYSNGKITISEVTGDIVIAAKGDFNADGHLQQLPDAVCSDTNLWNALEPENIYYTVNGWGNVTAGTAWSITFPVQAGDQIWATSFGKSGENGDTANGVRITWFDENGVLATVDRNTVYKEFVANGYITAPEGALALNVTMASNNPNLKVYILNRDHTYENGICTACGEADPDYHIPGDINGDGDVNNKDVTRLFRYLSDYDVEVVEAALDVNGDGSVNNKDLTRLFRYLSGYEVDIH